MKNPFRSLRIVISLVLLLALTASPLLAAHWEKLGSRSVGYTVDRDEIESGLRDGRFRQIKLQVKSAAVRFRDVKVHFENGDVQDIKLSRRIRAGGETRPIDLDGDRRVIDKVVFWHDTDARPRKRPRATVVLWAR